MSVFLSPVGGAGAQFFDNNGNPLTDAPYGENSMQIYINGVYQQRNTYSVSGTTLTFSEAPPSTSSIEVLYN